MACSLNKSTNSQLPPNNPKGLVGQAMSSSVIAISWLDASSNESGFVIYRGIAPPIQPFDTVAANISEYHDIGLTDSTTYIYFVKAINRYGISEASNLAIISTLHSTDAPYAPTDPFPANYAVISGVSTRLSWHCQDPEFDQLTYTLNFGSIPNPPPLETSIQANSYDPGNLMPNTTYFWRVVASDPSGNETSGPIWRFSTTQIGNRPPDIPSNPSPPDGSANIGIDAHLDWQCTDPDSDFLTYDLYFGMGNPPPFLHTQGTTSYDPPGRLLPAVIYYWRIVAHDSHSETSGPVWKFITYPGM